MAWEWVGSVATGAVGLAGITGTYLTGKKQRESQASVAREQDDRKLRMAAQEHKRKTYNALIGKLHTISTSAMFSEQLTSAVRATAEKRVESIEFVARLRKLTSGRAPDGITSETWGESIAPLTPEQIEKLESMIDEQVETSIDKELERLGFGRKYFSRTELEDVYIVLSEVAFIAANTLGERASIVTLKVIQFVMLGESSGMTLKDVEKWIDALRNDMRVDIEKTP